MIESLYLSFQAQSSKRKRSALPHKWTVHSLAIGRRTNLLVREHEQVGRNAFNLLINGTNDRPHGSLNTVNAWLQRAAITLGEFIKRGHIRYHLEIHIWNKPKVLE
jgi:hypothetical protein